jgi:hypothetical protein
VELGLNLTGVKTALDVDKGITWLKSQMALEGMDDEDLEGEGDDANREE